MNINSIELFSSEKIAALKKPNFKDRNILDMKPIHRTILLGSNKEPLNQGTLFLILDTTPSILSETLLFPNNLNLKKRKTTRFTIFFSTKFWMNLLKPIRVKKISADKNTGRSPLEFCASVSPGQQQQLMLQSMVVVVVGQQTLQTC